MKILRYWKTIDMPGVAGCTVKIVPVTSVTSNEAFFDKIVEAVKATDFSYTIEEVKIIERRGHDN